MTTTTIDCQTCPVRGRHCGDCFVPVLGRLWLGTPTVPAQVPVADEQELPGVLETEQEGQSDARPTTVALTSDELAAVGAFVRAGLVCPEEADRLRAELVPTAGYAAG